MVRGTRDHKIESVAIEVRRAADILSEVKRVKKREKLTGCGVSRNVDMYVEFTDDKQLATTSN